MNSNGVYHVGFILFCIPFLIATIGIQTLWIHWNKVVETQLRLDQCVGEKTLLLNNTLKRLGTLNRSMQATRLAISAANTSGNLAGAATLQTILIITAQAQNALMVRWRVEQISWITHRGCSFFWDVAPPLPDIPASRIPYSDGLGPRPLTWNAGNGKLIKLRVQLLHPPRQAAALIETLSKDFGLSPQWKMRWTRAELTALY